jgi:putative SOS response-associated peptidase YedK
MPVYSAPDDDDEPAPRDTYNFAPGNYGLVYRADVPDWGNGPSKEEQRTGEAEVGDEHPAEAAGGATEETLEHEERTETPPKETHYRLQTMKWGLIPFWTKRRPDYGSMMKTINCRSDSLAENRGMWNAIKGRKRCVVVAQGFYEWLKKGKDKVPHYTKRADGQLMCFAGLWDVVQYPDSDEKLYTYTIITTDSNKQLSFLHDRMPVILENGSEEMFRWLNPEKFKWDSELQAILKPYQGELECYPVPKEVGKVGNNSPNFIVPINSTENKNNIANFFGQKPKSQTEQPKDEPATKREPIKKEEKTEDEKIKQETETVDQDGSENKAPLPVPKDGQQKGVKREHTDSMTAEMPPLKAAKTSPNSIDDQMPPVRSTGRQTRSATTNDRGVLNPPKQKVKPVEKGNQKISGFFKKT